jgi:large subunit ribosomal protein L35
MPKLKTNSSAKKRFKSNAKGAIKHRRANRSHILTKKATKRLRQLRHDRLLASADVAMARRMLRGS